VWIGGDVNRRDGTGPLLAFPVHGVGIVNLEGPVVSARQAPDPHLRLFNTPAGLGALAKAGVRVAGIVNNHRADAGSPAETAAALGANGIVAAGYPEGPARLVVDGVTLHTRAIDLSDGAPPDLAAALGATGAGDGPSIVLFHTAGTASYLPAAPLRAAVDAALAAGADVIAVSGSHLVGPVERRGGAVIAWGLGNVGFACDCTRETEALLLEVDLPGGTAHVRPIAAGLFGAPATAAPDPAGIFDLLDAIGSTELVRHGDTATLPAVTPRP
jgi:poly-gamma-glutamate capsule biosynthesis protein CapA/YwtB (metallophosphatase superfamily)